MSFNRQRGGGGGGGRGLLTNISVIHLSIFVIFINIINYSHFLTGFRGAGGGGGRGGGGGFGRGGGGGGGFGRGGGGFNRGGRGAFDQGPPERVIPLGNFSYTCQNDLVCKVNIDDVPYFNAPIFLENKEQIGKIDEIFGTVRDYSVSIKLSDNVYANSFKESQMLYIDPGKLLPISRFLPKPPQPKGVKKRGAGGAGPSGRGRGGFGGESKRRNSIKQSLIRVIFIQRWTRTWRRRRWRLQRWFWRRWLQRCWTWRWWWWWIQ